MPLITTPGQLMQRSEIYRQLAQVISAGIPIIKGLEIVSRNSSGKFAESIHGMVQRLNQGESVGDVWQYLGPWVTEFDIALVRAAEAGGRLDAVFRILADHYQAQSQMLRRILTELAYPVFVFHFGVVLFPFIGWFSGSSGILSLLLTIVGILAPIYAIVFFCIQAAKGTHGEKWRMKFERITRPIPLFGTGRHCIALARLALSLQALLNSAVDVIAAWEMAAAASGSAMIHNRVLSWKRPIASGSPPSEMVNSAPDLFPSMFANLYHTGEVSGKLDESLLRISDHYRDEGNRKIHLLAKMVPQFILIAVALFVAVKVIGFYVNYFNQVKAAGGL